MTTRLAVLLASLIWLCADGAAAQETHPLAEGEPHHRLQFRSAAARVFSVEVPARATMLYHRHPTEQLVLVVRSGRLRNEVIGRAPVEHETGDPGTMVSIESGSVHRQTNLGDAPARWVGVEMARPGQTFSLEGWPSTANRGGTRSWAPGAVPWRSAEGGRTAVTLWSDVDLGERGELEKLAAGSSSGRPAAGGTERIVPLAGKMFYRSGSSRRALELGVLAPVRNRRGTIMCDPGAECIFLVVTSRL